MGQGVVNLVRRCSCWCFWGCSFGSCIPPGGRFQRGEYQDSLGGDGEEGVGAEVDGVLVAVIHMILLLHILGRDTRLSKKDGDLDSGQEQLLVRLVATWQVTGVTDNKNQEAVHGLEVTAVADSIIHHRDEAALVQAHLLDIRVLGLAQHQEDS